MLLASCAQDAYIRLWRVSKENACRGSAESAVSVSSVLTGEGGDIGEELKLTGNEFSVVDDEKVSHKYTVTLESVLIGISNVVKNNCHFVPHFGSVLMFHSLIPPTLHSHKHIYTHTHTHSLSLSLSLSPSLSLSLSFSLFNRPYTGHEDWTYSVRWHPYVPDPSPGHQPLSLLSTSMDKTMVLWQPDSSSGVWLEQVLIFVHQYYNQNDLHITVQVE